MKSEDKPSMKPLWKTLISLLIILAAAPGTLAAKTFVHEIDQPFAGSQSPDDALTAAIAKAKMEVMEKAGTYMESITVVENFILTRDEIVAVAGGILNTEIVSRKNYATPNRFGIILVTRVEVDTNYLQKRMQRLLEDRTALEKYREIQAREKKLLQIISDLEKKNSALQDRTATDDDQQEALQKQYNSTIRALPSADWNRKAIALWRGGKYTDAARALEYLDHSIRIDPNNPTSRNNRGVAYYDLGLLQRALEDYNQAIQLNPAYAAAYNNRGTTWFRLREYRKALADFDQVVRLQPERVEAYLNRGAAHKNLMEYRQALDDFGRVLALSPDIGDTPRHQDSVLTDLNELKRLCEKARQACDMGLCRAMRYLDTKGFCRQE